MSLYTLKPWFRQQLLGITSSLHNAGVTPNHVTISAIILSIAYGISMIYVPILFLLFPLFALFRMALNAIDGLMATTFNLQSKEGMWLNEVGDIVSDFFLLVGFCLYIPLPFLAFIIFLSILTEIIGFQSLLEGRERNYQGPMGKSDRVFLLSIFSLFIYLYGYIPGATFILTIMILFLLKTIYNRVKAYHAY